MQMTLDAERIIATVDTLALRVRERFPEADLSQVAEEFTNLARDLRDDALALGRPNWRLRLTVIGILIAGLVLFGSVVTELRFKSPVPEATTLVQIIEPAANIALMMALGIAFLVSLEGRWKRKRALVSLHSLRSMIHIIDMHQLTKDPSLLLDAIEPTPSSPKRTMGRLEIHRYLDYCSELLSLSGKCAALFAQSVQDPVVIDAVNELEILSTNLSRKIWQKIMILDRAGPAAPSLVSAVEAALGSDAPADSAGA